MKMIRSWFYSTCDTKILISWLYRLFYSELQNQLQPVPKNGVDFI